LSSFKAQYPPRNPDGTIRKMEVLGGRSRPPLAALPSISAPPGANRHPNSFVVRAAAELSRRIARCETEIALVRMAPESEAQKAYLPAMGEADWHAERRLIEKGAE